MHQLPLIFSPEDLMVMSQLRSVFDPDNLCNPHKIFPTSGIHTDVRTPKRQVPL